MAPRLLREESHQLAVGLVGDGPEGAVGADGHVADALAQVGQHSLAVLQPVELPPHLALLLRIADPAAVGRFKAEPVEPVSPRQLAVWCGLRHLPKLSKSRCSIWAWSEPCM